jgi:hypothetical protein
MLRPKVTKDRAQLISKKSLSNVVLQLQMLPYYIYEYSCQISQNNGETVTEIRGKLALNTITGDVYKWSDDYETVDQIAEEHSKLTSKLTDEDGLKRIKEAIIEMNTKVIETMEETESVTIIEKKKVKPKEDAISIKRTKLVFLPIWCAEGSNGQMIIDATTGDVLKSS